MSVTNGNQTPANDNGESGTDGSPKASPCDGPFPGIVEAEFNRLCEEFGRPIKMPRMYDILLSKKDTLRFWQAVAFVLRSEEHPNVAVSSFVDHLGHTKLYITSNDPMTDARQREVTGIIHMFLDLRPLQDVIDRLVPRHLHYILKRFQKNSTVFSPFCQGFSWRACRKGTRIDVASSYFIR